MPALSSIRETDGLTLELSEPVNEQISDGVVRLVADADRAAASSSPPQGVEVSSAVAEAAAQPKPDQPGSKAGSVAVKEQATASAGPDQAPPSGVTVKKEDVRRTHPQCGCVLRTQTPVRVMAVVLHAWERVRPPSWVEVRLPSVSPGCGAPCPHGTWLPVPSLGVGLGKVEGSSSATLAMPTRIPLSIHCMRTCLRAALVRGKAEIWSGSSRHECSSSLSAVVAGFLRPYLRVGPRPLCLL